MRIIGKDGKEYLSVEECQKADMAYDKAQKDAEVKARQKATAAEDAVAKAELNLREAKDNFTAVVDENNQRYMEARERVVKAGKEFKNAKAKYEQATGKIYSDGYSTPWSVLLKLLFP